MKLFYCLPDQERLGQNTGKTVGPKRPKTLGQNVFLRHKRPAILDPNVQKLHRKVQLGWKVWYPVQPCGAVSLYSISAGQFHYIVIHKT